MVDGNEDHSQVPFKKAFFGLEVSDLKLKTVVEKFVIEIFLQKGISGTRQYISGIHLLFWNSIS